MRVAVTGGSGVVGSAVVRHLVDSGHEVWALARSSRSERALAALGANVVKGDLLDPGALERLMADREIVYHLAGVNELCSRDPSRMWRVNVEGTVQVLDAAVAAGSRRLIHTSSAVTIGEEQGTVGSEHTKHRGHFLSEYERSKTVSERLALDRNREIEVVSVNPSSVQGPGRATGTGALFLAAARGDLPFMIDTTLSLVDIDDCARGHLLAAEKGSPGERYLLSGPVTTVRAAVRLLNAQVGRHRSPWFLRHSAVAAMGTALDAVTRVVRPQTPICAESVRVLLHGHRYDGSRAEDALGLEYASLEETIRRTVSWFRSSGLLG